MIKALLTPLTLMALMMGCRPAVYSAEPVLVSHIYAPSDAVILNPERGFFSAYQLPGPSDFSSVREQGLTLVHLNIHLNNWRETEIPEDVLAGLAASFAGLRVAGIKAIVRFSYNQGLDPVAQRDASKAQIMRHIGQLTPLLQNNADVIAWVEAGFIGAWGEWHNSTNGLDNLQDKREILLALLEALPETRMVQLRYPSDVIEMFPDPADAAKARVGHHNDCFLSSDTDVGTYVQNGTVTKDRDQRYLSELARLTPMSGETCAYNPPRSDCENALKEMVLLHFSALSADYHKDVLRGWREEGCFNEMDHRLGYRLTLTSAEFNERVRPGGILRLTVNLQNDGFANIINRRPLYLVLEGPPGKSTIPVKLNLDPRSWAPGKASFSVRLSIPSSITAGTYKLALWLPDEYESLRENPFYAIRFANDGTWNDATGFNVLGSVTITEDAGGSHQPGEVFKVLELTSSHEINK